MFKLLGFLFGSAIAITAIVLLLGMPEFHLTKLADHDDRFDAAVEKLKEKQQEAERLIAQADQVMQTAEPQPPAAPEPAAEIPDAAPEPLPTESQGEADESFPPEEAVEPAHTLPPDDVVAEASWYAFWNPFRSEIAARGFVAQLEKVTGLDYRIVKVKAGVYQVAFAYADDQERVARLSQIQAATGLDLSGTL